MYMFRDDDNDPMSAMLPAGFVLQSPIVCRPLLSCLRPSLKNCQLMWCSWCEAFLCVVAQASAIRVVSTTLAMLPVDIFVNVNRIGTNNPLFTPVFPSHLTRWFWP